MKYVSLVALFAASAAVPPGVLAAAPFATPAPLFAPPVRADLDVVVWHTFDGPQSTFFTKLVEEFNAGRGVTGDSGASGRVIAETGMELPQALIEQLEDGLPPDAVLAPSDLIGLAETLALSEVPPEVAGARFGPEVASSVELDGRSLGAPILEGNHLMLLYNKQYVPKPATDFAAMATEAEALKARGVGVIAWQFQEPYLFAPFLAALDAFPVEGAGSAATIAFSTRNPGSGAGVDRGVAAALTRYRSLADSGLVSRDCDYGCVTRDFRAGRYAYAIDGDWAVLAAAEALGDDLGLAPLPALDGRALVSLSATHAMLFPGGSLQGPRRDVLLAFAAFLQSGAVQRRWHTQARRLPVDASAFAASGRVETEVRRLLMQSRRVPVAPGMALAWPALRKGLKLYLAGVFSAERAAGYMQHLVDEASAPESRR